MKGAIAGFGQVAEFGHAPAFNNSRGRFSIEAVADSFPGRLKRAGEIFPQARLYKGIEELFAREKGLDFIDIATPPVSHPGYVLKALENGLHVLCEKPLVLAEKDFERIKARAESLKRCVFTVHNWKKAAPILKLKEIIDGGSLGNIEHAQLHVVRKNPAVCASGGGWRQNPAVAGGGILVDHGWHNFYLLCGILGRAPVSVSAVLGFSGGAGAEDQAECFVNFPNGTGLVSLSWRGPFRKNFVFVRAANAVMELRDSDIIVEKESGPPEVFLTGEKLSDGSAHPKWMAAILDDFAREVENPDKRGINLAEAGICVQLITGAYKSFKNGGKTIFFKEFKKED